MYGKKYFGVLRSTFIVNEEGKFTHIIDKVDTKAHAEQILSLLKG
jgi:peroxiredoxin Q/BCP